MTRSVGRKQHMRGKRHQDNVRQYYLQFLKKDVMSGKEALIIPGISNVPLYVQAKPRPPLPLPPAGVALMPPPGMLPPPPGMGMGMGMGIGMGMGMGMGPGMRPPNLMAPPPHHHPLSYGPIRGAMNMPMPNITNMPPRMAPLPAFAPMHAQQQQPLPQQPLPQLLMPLTNTNTITHKEDEEKKKNNNNDS